MPKKPEVYDPVTAHVPGVHEPTHKKELAALRSAGDPPSPQSQSEAPKKKSKLAQKFEEFGIKIS